MDIERKLHILAAAARYDASCASSGSTRQNRHGGLGNASSSPVGICHSWAADGRCISLLKVLFSNDCRNNCAYCVNRRTNDLPRATFTPAEVIRLVIDFYRRNYIEGLFLSSGVFAPPDTVMEGLLQVVRKLREEENFNGYIHLKVIPGASRELIRQVGFYVDRLSVNIELPTERGLKLLAPDKKKAEILDPMAYIGAKIRTNVEERRKYKSSGLFVPAGQSTQLIVGATPESDRQILRLAEALYHKVSLKRVYYSAYIPVGAGPMLPAISAPPLRRENRLYQADWLLRFYGFTSEEITDSANPFLAADVDPKTGWALRNLQFYPVEVNRADYRTLLRVPGIGPQSAQKILTARRSGTLDFKALERIGVTMKRARYFILCGGKLLDRPEEAYRLRTPKLTALEMLEERQLPLFGGETVGGGVSDELLTV